MPKLIDLSRLIENNMPVYPGDTSPKLTHTKFLDKDYHNNHSLEISMHVGTHLDAPMHMTHSHVYMSDMPLDSFMGAACVLDVRDQPAIEFRAEFEEIVWEQSIVLLYTGHGTLYGTDSYYVDHPSVSEELCNFLIKKRIKMLGVDSPSPDKYPFPIHKALLNAGIYILENLTNLDKLIDVPEFEVIALPLKIRADGSMTRAVARIL